jgi:uncharacterized protein (TIGR02300 family)
MSTVHARRKAMRGTKRICQACDVRFYDLGRSSILCPMCGASYTPPAESAVQATARAAPFASKTGWHRQPLKRLLPAPPAAEALARDRFATAAADQEIEEPATVESETGSVLEQEDDTDVARLVDHADADENEPR